MDKRLEKQLRKFKNRIFLRRFLRYLSIAFANSLLMALIMIIYSKFYPLFIKDKLIILFLVFPFLFSTLLAIAKRATNVEAAREADYNGLDEIVSSAYEYSLKGDNTLIEEELYEKAINKLENMESKNRVKILVDKKWMISIIILIAIIVPINMLSTEISSSVRSELKEIKNIEEMQDEIEKKIDEIEKLDSKALLKELKEALKDIHNFEKIDEEIFKAKKELNEQVRKNLELKLSQNDSSSLSENQKNDILSSDNSLKTLNDMLRDSEVNRNVGETSELKELLDNVNDEDMKKSSDAIESLEELKEKVDEHNKTSDSRAGT